MEPKKFSRAIAQAALSSPESFRAFAQILLSSPEAARAIGIEASSETIEQIRALAPQQVEAIYARASAALKAAPAPAPARPVSLGHTLHEDPANHTSTGKVLFTAPALPPALPADPREVAAFGRLGPDKLAAARDYASSFQRMAESGRPSELSLAEYLDALLS